MGEEDLHNFSSNLNENGDKSDSEHILKIGKTTRGCPKLCLDGFFYTIERKNPNTNCCFWKCERTGTKNLAKCSGRISTSYKEIESETLFCAPIQEITQHNHLPQPEKTEALLAVSQMLERAKISNERPRVIIKNCQLGVDSEVAPFLIRHDAMRQRISRVRSKKVDYGPNPKNINEIDIPLPLRSSYSGKNFLLRDSGVDQLGRIFGTDDNLALLKSNKIWYGDGTFSVAPDLFYQMNTLNIIIKNKNLPIIFALLPNKEQKTYERLFELLFVGFENIDYPKKIMHDFEKAVLNALRLKMPMSIILGCYFHFCQSLWRNMQKKGLSNSYISNKEIRTCFKYLKALCFVPISDVIRAFNLIEGLAPPAFKPMLTYLEKNYIGKPKRNATGIRAVPPFPIQIWNCFERVLHGEERTNNSIEAWHKQFEVFIYIMLLLILSVINC
jgi:hypothetical protein